MKRSLLNFISILISATTISLSSCQVCAIVNNVKGVELKEGLKKEINEADKKFFKDFKKNSKISKSEDKKTS